MSTKDIPPSFRTSVAGLAAMGSITLREQEYTGEYLAMLVSLNPEQVEREAARTPQLVAELGRLVAAAFRDKELADVVYRVWREGVVFEMGNDVEAACNAGFECAARPGKDAKGKDKEPKCPSNADVEAYMRTLPEYREYYSRKLDAEETWSTLYAAYTALMRVSALRAFSNNGGIDSSPRDTPRERPEPSEPVREPIEQDENRRHAGHDDKPVTAADLERRLPPPKPLPPPGAKRAGPPPPRRGFGDTTKD